MLLCHLEMYPLTQPSLSVWGPSGPLRTWAPAPFGDLPGTPVPPGYGSPSDLSPTLPAASTGPLEPVPETCLGPSAHSGTAPLCPPLLRSSETPAGGRGWCVLSTTGSGEDKLGPTPLLPASSHQGRGDHLPLLQRLSPTRVAWAPHDRCLPAGRVAQEVLRLLTRPRWKSASAFYFLLKALHLKGCWTQRWPAG